MATRLLYDSVDPFAIPADAAMVAGYVDGIFGPDHALFGQPGWDAAAWARFRGATHVGIAVNASTNAGDVLDVENGDATPAQVPGWVAMRKASGHPRPNYYSARGTHAAVEAALSNAGLSAPWWAATLDGTRSVIGATAVQYAGSALSGGNYDLSIVYDDNFPFTHLEVDMTAEEHQLLRDIWNFLQHGADDPAPGETLPRHDSILLGLPEGLTGIKDLQTAVARLQQPSVDAAALAAALAAEPGFLDAIAASVVKLAGAKLSS